MIGEMMPDTTKIPEEVLKDLLQLRNQSALLAAQASESQARFRSTLLQAMAEVGFQVEDAALCLRCGTVRLASQAACPSCSVGDPHG